MIPPLQAVRKILWGNLKLNGKKIPVIKRDYPYDKIPCVTIDDSGGSSFNERHILTEKYPLNSSHPQFDKNEPFKKYPQQVLRQYYTTTLNINAWTNTVDEQEQLNNNIIDLFNKAQSDYYLFCNKYMDGDCSYSDNTCFALHFNDKRSVKGQCPNPSLYGYENVFTTYNLIRSSFYLDQPFSLNDINKDEIVYRSVLKLHTAYYTDHIIGGIIPTKIKLSEDTRVL